MEHEVDVLGAWSRRSLEDGLPPSASSILTRREEEEEEGNVVDIGIRRPLGIILPKGDVQSATRPQSSA